MTHFRTCLKREGRSGRRARLKGDREWEERNGAAVCSGTTAQSSTCSRPGRNAANVRKSETRRKKPARDGASRFASIQTRPAGRQSVCRRTSARW
jgi:hypothetical protein